MLKIIIPSLALIPTIWWTPARRLWTDSYMMTMLIASASLTVFWSMSPSIWNFNCSYTSLDDLSSPLIFLSCWLLPLMLLASQNHTQTQNLVKQRLYITLLVSLQVLLVLAFSMNNLISFFIMFEATLLPTLIIITRWGSQKERLEAGKYFMLYTLVGSLPLLVALMVMQSTSYSLSFLGLSIAKSFYPNTYSDMIWWVACFMAFLVKMPMYTTHLWLPKAHVEAPIAGSMVLAAVLLKLGGYGMMRMAPLMPTMTVQMSPLFIILSLWGAVMTSLICLRQTDIKALIAYSSVGHMGLVIMGILSQTALGINGALILMFMHGLTSSALFCLAFTNYERSHSRTLILARGVQTLLPLMAAWWFFSSLANMALPPLPSAVAELSIIMGMFDWSKWTLALLGGSMLLVAGYSLYLFLVVQRGVLPPHMKAIPPSYTREHLLMSLHVMPMILLTVKPELIFGWTT
uniref:NADH-ubiquinone oxidoreductase chain 4 n=1 Tax=Solenostomus cyanopterus TaxID=270527 RepID=A7BHS0_9TELE|nr:NADH dehydrogenase subunit 4 [Solenostomus cyanopterus]BAF74895.1 NADH dehydrogenase subunit 4 [Solenostomus cyanopterus]BBU25692.1 NADH dehydrogenase subunit 4 [Solenostomus cyanopterus]